MSGFEPGIHPLIADAHHRHPGVRLSRTDLVFDALASAIFEQKVTGMQAFGAWRRIVTWFGERAPGPTPRPLFAPPTIEGWRRIPSWAWHRAGLEPPQARTVVATAQRGDSIVRALSAAARGEEHERILTALRGVGPWTSAETRIRAFGDPDAVSVGDFHLAHEVGFALDGQPRGRRRDARAPGRVARSPSARHPADRRERSARAAPRSSTAPRRPPRALSQAPAGGCRAQGHDGAMFEPLPDLPPGVLGFRAVGTVDASDYRTVLDPAVDAVIAKGEKVNLVLVLGEEFSRYSLSALWQDALLEGKPEGSWGRIALVTHRKILGEIVQGLAGPAWRTSAASPSPTSMRRSPGSGSAPAGRHGLTDSPAPRPAVG